MTSSSDNSYQICCGGWCFIVFILSFPFFIQFHGEYQLLDYYSETKCNISSATFPRSVSNFDNSTLWKTCDCGKYCTSLAPCLTLYSNQSKYTIKRDYESQNSECTFVESECINGEDPSYLELELNKTIETARYYLQNEFDCFIHEYDPLDNFIYLDLSGDIDMLVLVAVFLGLSLCVILIIIGRLLTDNEQLSCCKYSCCKYSSSTKTHPEKVSFAV
jgi:hypothetical protein